MKTEAEREESRELGRAILAWLFMGILSIAVIIGNPAAVWFFSAVIAVIGVIRLMDVMTVVALPWAIMFAVIIVSVLT